MDAVFRALADPNRRYLLDLLRQRNGQTLGELCERLDMTRQSVTQHLGLLEAADLVSTVRRGREKLHHLNPVPLHEIQERWIDRFERPRPRVLGALKRQAEGGATSERPPYVCVTYLRSTPDRVWQALTDPELTAAYWGHRNESPDWREGSAWAHVRDDGSGVSDGGGEVLVSDPPRRLVLSWDSARLTFGIERLHGVVELTVTHEDPGHGGPPDVALGWPAVLANLKTLLETGSAMSVPPWKMHR